MSVSLLFPELLLLLVPLLFALYWRGRARGLGLAARVLIVCMLTLLAAVPLAPLGGRGADVVVVVDRSRSMPPGARERALELVRQHRLPVLEEAMTLQAYADAEERRGEVDTGRSLREEAVRRYSALGIAHPRRTWSDVFAPEPVISSPPKVDDHE